MPPCLKNDATTRRTHVDEKNDAPCFIIPQAFTQEHVSDCYSVLLHMAAVCLRHYLVQIAICGFKLPWWHIPCKGKPHKWLITHTVQFRQEPGFRQVGGIKIIISGNPVLIYAKTRREQYAMTSEHSQRIEHYYRNRHVRNRILEFLGCDRNSEATCMYVSHYTDSGKYLPRAEPVSSVNSIQDYRSGMFRSLWDRRSLVADLDIEYVNFDFPAEAYLDPHRSFDIQGTVRAALNRTLEGFGIEPLRILTGRGYHYLWSISRSSGAFSQLAWLGRKCGSLHEYYRAHPCCGGAVVDDELGYAYSGLGMVIEYLCHSIVRLTAKDSPVPVQLTAVAAGPGERGREVVSLDISEYADPLNGRVVHVPFSPYLKPVLKHGIVHDGIAGRIPPMTPVPMNGMDVYEGISCMRSLEKSAVRASETSATIPDMSEQTTPLITAYLGSALAAFHKRFYSVNHDSPGQWPQTYDRFDPGALPRCVARVLRYPNDLLLTPEGIRQVVRSLYALGWHPRHIAGLVRSKYERDFGWGNEWYAYSASARADTYTRIFAGLITVKLDQFVDFNCQSTREKGYCFIPQDNCGIDTLRHKALERSTL
ncbi:MAG: hypothetical protein GF350_15675 [Chitinivibrionales bacterium]|nr:hypothetical protein [Chitinivibrionales bacterium]